MRLRLRPGRRRLLTVCLFPFPNPLLTYVSGRSLTVAGLHDHFLAMWGTPIGELWNLEQLAEACKKENKYSFFFTSAPLNEHGGIASPPNALAIL